MSYLRYEVSGNHKSCVLGLNRNCITTREPVLPEFYSCPFCICASLKYMRVIRMQSMWDKGSKHNGKSHNCISLLPSHSLITRFWILLSIVIKWFAINYHLWTREIRHNHLSLLILDKCRTSIFMYAGTTIYNSHSFQTWR